MFLNQLKNLAILAVISSSAAPLAAEEKISTLAQLQRHWKVYRQEHTRLTAVEFKQKYRVEHSGEEPFSGSIVFSNKRSGKLFKNSHRRGKEPVRVFLANDRYTAYLKGDGEAWAILELGRFSKCSDRTLVADAAAEWDRAFGLGGLSCDVWMLESLSCRVLSVAQEDSGIVTVAYEKDPALVPDRPPEGVEVSPQDKFVRMLLLMFPSGSFKFDPRYGYAISEFEGRNPAGKVLNNETFGDYRRVTDELWYPYLIQRTSEESVPAGKRVMVGKQFPLSLSTKKVDVSEFTVSHYGLPEPVDSPTP